MQTIFVPASRETTNKLSQRTIALIKHTLSASFMPSH